MRRIFVAAMVALTALRALAMEAPHEASLVAVDTILPGAEAGVVVTPVPMHGAVVEMTPLSSKPKLRQSKRSQQAKKKVFPSLLLSRSERNRLALLATSVKPGVSKARQFFDEENNEYGFDELVMHRFFNRPKLAAEPDLDDEDAQDISDELRLRLFLARMKAVESHALAQAPDTGEELTDRVTARLLLARQKAVVAHALRFG